ncbi:DUF3306 domain-containing protein [Elioraea rosea]|uniref:DUF3306 domain-containing protein n=1 Tax=Elioraea rosea TaxID=2492390 RepID=UPI001182E4FD|nr:DUF3306 domain-containing protein [Elioraea rosea]
MAEDESRGGEGFLSRWSRRKQAAREGVPVDDAARPEAQPEPVAPECASASAPKPGPAPPAEPDPEIDLASLPPIEELTVESDVTVFLRKGVPAALRNAALRRAWSLDPSIRDFIGPADYAWDWNTPGGAPGYMADLASGPDVEALADRILGLVRDRPTPEAAGDAEPRQDGAAPPSPVRIEPAAPEPVRNETQAVAAAPPERAPPAGAKARPPAPVADPPRPRHGGAVPT